MQQLKKQFKGEKVYEMLVKNKKFVLPFQMPKPSDNMSENTKLMYIVEKIFQKIFARRYYGIYHKKKIARYI